MSQASPELVWQVIKKGNSFLRKGSNGHKDPIFSAEKGNLYARHSFKYSGAAQSCTPHAARRLTAASLRWARVVLRVALRCGAAGRSGCNPRAEGLPARAPLTRRSQAWRT